MYKWMWGVSGSVFLPPEADPQTDRLSSRDNDRAEGSLSVWKAICCILPSTRRRRGPEEEIFPRLSAPSARLTRQWVMEADRFVFLNKVMCTMWAGGTMRHLSSSGFLWHACRLNAVVIISELVSMSLTRRRPSTVAHSMLWYELFRDLFRPVFRF